MVEVISTAVGELSKNSPMLAACVLVVVALYYALTKEHKSHLDSKDKEIERLVKEKNALQEVILSNRLSTKSKKK